MTVCSTCNDTHRMELGDRVVMCTRCPTPCEQCRQRAPGFGPGAYCGSTPCACACHRKTETNGQRYLRLRWENDSDFRRWIITLAHNLAIAGWLCAAWELGKRGATRIWTRDEIDESSRWFPGCGRSAP